MRICTPHCGLAPETTSGGETYERELLVRLGRAGVALEIILARGKPHPPGVPGWRVHRFAIGRGLRWWVAPLVVPPAIARVYRAVGFDLLRAHSVRYIGPAALFARTRYRLPVPVVAHHHHLDASPLNGLIERRVIDRMDSVVVGSEFARRQLREELGARTDHVRVVPYGVDARFAPRPAPAGVRARHGVGEGPIVMFLGGLKPRKNLALLIDAWPGVLTGFPEAKLLVAGRGALLPQLRAQARRRGVDGSVIFTGYVPEADKVEYLALADVFVFPSALEGFGLAVAEAMACGIPVVASDRGSLPELVVDGETGLLCDADSPGAFVERVRRLLGDAGLRRKLGAAAAARVNRWFRWERCVQETRRVYEEVLEAWRRQGGGA
jgi:glycosyltransferase involved in cell wall biosynthesis